MTRRLLIIAFVLSVAASSLAAISQADETCVMACCKRATLTPFRSDVASFCCAVHCTEPGGTNPASTTVISSPAPEKRGSAQLAPATYTNVLYIRQARFPQSPTPRIAGCTTRYLDTHSLLI
jgi:hypothetical protein